MSFLSFGFINCYSHRGQFFLLMPCRSIYLIEHFSGNVMAELAWEFVRARPWILVVFCYWLAGCDGELSSEAVFHFGDGISASWRDINLRGAV